MTTATNHMPAAPTELSLPDGTWTVDPQRSEIAFAVQSIWGCQPFAASYPRRVAA